MGNDKSQTPLTIAEGETVKVAREHIALKGDLMVVTPPGRMTRAATRERMLREAASKGKPGTVFGILLPWVKRTDGTWTRQAGFLPGGTPYSPPTAESATPAAPTVEPAK